MVDLPENLEAPWFGRAMYRLLPVRRGVVLANMRRVFGESRTDEELRSLAEAYYAHFLSFFLEFVKMFFLSDHQKSRMVRLEGAGNLQHAVDQGKGVLLLTGHFGNWEVATVAGIAQFAEWRGKFHFIRRPLKPKWFNDLVMRRFVRAGFGTLAKSGSIDDILELLEQDCLVVSIFDQHASPRIGVESEFFGHPVLSMKSLAILALATGAPVVPCSSWREPDGSHVLHFEEPLPLEECEKTRDSIRVNTQHYNHALERIILRHPEQWIWMHRRWKHDPAEAKRKRRKR